MSRSVSANLKNHFGLSTTTYCFCWLVQPTVGILTLPAEGFTSLDRDIVIAGQLFKSRSNAAPTSLPFSIELPNNAVEITLVFDAGALDARKVATGYYDRAVVQLYAVNYVAALANPATDQVLSLMGGTLEKAEWDENAATFELSTWAAHVNREGNAVYLPQCPYPRFGRGFCHNGADVDGLADGPAIADWTRTATVASVVSGSEIFVSGFSEDEAWADFGILRFDSGDNDGAEVDIARHLIQSGGVRLLLNIPAPLTIAVGDSLFIEKGCARTPEACKAFLNFDNFGGFPFFPLRDGMTKKNKVSSSSSGGKKSPF